MRVRGASLLDRALYLPQGSGPPTRSGGAARVSRTEVFLAPSRSSRSGWWSRPLKQSVPARWVLADAVYGSDGKFRRWSGAGPGLRGGGEEQREADDLAAVQIPGQVAVAAIGAAVEDRWQRLELRRRGTGRAGRRLGVRPVRPAPGGLGARRLCRRSLTQPDEVAYYLVYAPDGIPVEEMVRAAGSGGRSRTCSSWRKDKSASITTRCARGPGGIAT